MSQTGVHVPNLATSTVTSNPLLAIRSTRERTASTKFKAPQICDRARVLGTCNCRSSDQACQRCTAPSRTFADGINSDGSSG